MGWYWSKKWMEKERAKGDLKDFRQVGNPLGRGIVNQGKPRDILVSQLEPWKMRDSLVGNPPSQKIDGDVSITRASVEHAHMADSIAAHADLTRPTSVLEIGGGFGGLAWSLSMRAFDRLSYTFVDHPVHLRIQKYFIENALPALGRRFLTPQQFMTAAINGEDDTRYDLVTCTRAFGEMELAEALGYCTVLNWCVKPGGLLYVITWKKKVIKADDLRLGPHDWDLLVDRPWREGNMVERLYRRKGLAG